MFSGIVHAFISTGLNVIRVSRKTLSCANEDKEDEF